MTGAGDERAPRRRLRGLGTLAQTTEKARLPGRASTPIRADLGTGLQGGQDS